MFVGFGPADKIWGQAVDEWIEELRLGRAVGFLASCGGGLRRCGNGRVCGNAFLLIAGFSSSSSQKQGVDQPRFMAPPSIRLLDHHFPIIGPLHEKQQEAGDGEENNVHDAKCKTCLQHRTLLVDVKVQP